MRTLNYWALLAIGVGTSAQAWAAPPAALEPEPEVAAAEAPSDETAEEAGAGAAEEQDHELAGSEDADAELVAPADTEDDSAGATVDANAGAPESAAADTTCSVEPVTVRRFGTPGEVSVRLTDCAGRPNLAALPQLSQLAQPIAPHADEASAPNAKLLNPELLVRVQCVVDRFATRSIEIVSGYRPRARAGSRHHSADALDLRIDGVDNLELSEFARTLDATGVGYYPNSTFVHIDVREGTAYWVDRSGPGERPKYVRGAAVASAAAASDGAREDLPPKALAEQPVAKKSDAMFGAKAAPPEDRVRESRMIDVPSRTADEAISGDDPVPTRDVRAKQPDHAEHDAAPAASDDDARVAPELRAVYERALEVMERELAREQG